jgi:hypothetical protein
MKNRATVGIYLIAGLAVMLLCGCASKPRVKSVTLPSGAPGFEIRCNGLPWSACEEAATKACNGKYDASNKKESYVPVLDEMVVKRSMLVECNH